MTITFTSFQLCVLIGLLANFTSIVVFMHANSPETLKRHGALETAVITSLGMVFGIILHIALHGGS